MKDTAPPALADASALPVPAPAVATAYAADGGLDVPASLPRDHPAWQPDSVLISARVRAVLETLRPLTIRVLSFWDHLARSVVLGARRLEVDPSGCYRLL